MRRTKGTLVLFVAAAAGLGPADGSSAGLSVDNGAAGTWQQLLKLATTASAMHTTAHPDDEHAGVLALLSRGGGTRLALLTLTRGEAGDNAIGSELFDGLGLIRTEELRVADRYYGVDDQYFTTAIDYGYSKRLDEALEKWGKGNVLRDVVRVIRMNRPLVLISRFEGSPRDGHGNHEAAGLVTREAFRAAGDPAMFPEQIADGLRPWQPLKLYVGSAKEEDWTIRVDPGEYAPVLGDSYQNFASVGYSFQRSQTGGRVVSSRGPQYVYYKREGSTVTGPDREQSFFDGIDTTLSGMFKTLGRPVPGGAREALAAIEREVSAAVRAFRTSDPSASVPSLARGLRATREALRAAAAEPEAVFLLRVKEQQFQHAINTALGIDFAAEAQPAGLPEPTGPFAAWAPPPTMGAAVPGQTFQVRVQLTNRGSADVAPSEIAIVAARGFAVEEGAGALGTLKANDTASRAFTVTLADDAPLTSRPYFTRQSIRQNRYDVLEPGQIHRPAAEPAATAMVRYTVDGVSVEARQTVTRREANLPYGFETRELTVVPALALTLTPGTAIVPLAAPRKMLSLQVDLSNNWEGEITGRLSLELPPGWTSDPPHRAIAFRRSGERGTYRFLVRVRFLENKDYEVRAVATARGREFREGYEVMTKRDLETRYLYRPALTTVRGVDVRVPAGLNVGYVMGVGDQVPTGLSQLGATVTLLGEKELATGNLNVFDAVMVGTRAYAVREDLRTYNQRLLDYVKEGGNLIVFYNTQELIPDKYAPFPAVLPASAEEVSEEDSPVEIIAPGSPVLRWPNRITRADFDGWVEQRGSKFLASWDKAYTPVIATWDKGQAPQRGGWLEARHVKGHYTYFAYALHRQLPYGIPGAYRLLANLVSLGKPRPTVVPTEPGRPGPPEGTR